MVFIYFVVIQFFCHSNDINKIPTEIINYQNVKTESEQLDYITYYWLLSQISSSKPLKTQDLQEIISLLIKNHNFPNADAINNFVLKTDQFLNIEDKYLLINYITNFTPFAQIYVDRHKIPTEQFNSILTQAKNHNTLPQEFISYIKLEYTKYELLNKTINHSVHAKIAKQIAEIKDRDSQAILYTRLYLKGNGKYREYYKYAREKSLESEMLIHDKISFYAKNKNYKDISQYINHLPATLQYGDIWWENNQVIILEMIESGFAQSAYSLLQKIYLTRSHENFVRKEMLSGTLALFLQKPNEAYEHFYNVNSNTNYLVEKVQSAYFIAQCYSKLGNEEARKYWLTKAAEYPATFYGLRAFEELNNLPFETLTGSDEYARGQWVKNTQYRATLIRQRFHAFFMANFYKNTKTYDDLPKHISQMLAIAEILYNSTYTNYAKDFVISAVKQIENLSLFQPMLSHICETYNKYICHDAQMAAIQSGYINKEFFPTMQSVAINSNIQKHHLQLLHAIIKKESNFKPVIQSKVGAKGLMQVMPSTAKFICTTHGILYNQRRLNYDADYNIQLGTLYIDDLLTRYNGSYILALMAYNAGYGSLGKWEAVYSRPKTPAEMVIFIELIPFKETRNYVKRVMEYEAMYQYMLT